jgi:hypothetical protein
MSVVELGMRSTWKLRKKVVTVIKSEVTGGRRKSGMTWDEFFQAEWVKNNGVRAQLDVAKSKVSCAACDRRNRCAAPTQ